MEPTETSERMCTSMFVIFACLFVYLLIIYFFLISNFNQIDQNGIFPLVNVAIIIIPIIIIDVLAIVFAYLYI